MIEPRILILPFIMKFSLTPNSITISFQLSCLQTTSLLAKQSVTSYLMFCNDDLYGIKNIAALYPSGKVTIVNYSTFLLHRVASPTKNVLLLK